MHGRSIASLPIAVAVVAVLLSVATRAGAADPTAFAVNSTVDAVDASPGDGICATGGGQCTLRAVIQEANALPGPDVIALPSGTYTLTVAGGQVASGGLDISDDLEIRGAGAATTVIDANHLGRVLQVLSGTSIVSSVRHPFRPGDLARHRLLRKGDVAPAKEIASGIQEEAVRDLDAWLAGRA